MVTQGNITETKQNPEYATNLAPGKISIQNVGTHFHFMTESGLSITWNRKMIVQIFLSPHHKERVCGLCGNFDNKVINDMRCTNLNSTVH